uniref:Cathelicidin-derived antimicrobial peptide 1d n=1 Tax=Oncorhynchus mykiss TaxID=8022 RepID=A0A0F6QDU1_ONCMY|nr:cathelicidin-derived antimicrobial peptide 1d [Oncorhynchus mykiss]AKD58934.1 cathelicidin-derived antimicrobial peptide 1d [Oncorhynchus mykiss]
MKMKVQVRSLILLAVAVLQVRSRRSKVRICSRGKNCVSFNDEFIRDHSDGNRFA